MNEAAPADAAIADAGFHEGTTEQRLVRAGDGEQRAFAEVYDATSPRVFGRVLLIVTDRAQAEDVTREVYLDAWRHAKRFDPERDTAIAWLLQIAHARAVEHVRVTRLQRRRDTRIGNRDAPMTGSRRVAAR